MSQPCISDAELIKLCQPPWVQHISLSFGSDIWIGARDENCGYVTSKWVNPYSIKIFGLEGCLEAYEDYICSREDLMAEIPLMRGKELGCCCEDSERSDRGHCHGMVIRKVYLTWARLIVDEHGVKYFTSSK